jgi:hypothetical protein
MQKYNGIFVEFAHIEIKNSATFSVTRRLKAFLFNVTHVV